MNGRWTESFLVCEAVRPLISACSDGEADDLGRATVERHLRFCPDCRDFAELVEREQAELLFEAIRAEEPDPPAALVERMVAATGVLSRASGATSTRALSASPAATRTGASLSPAPAVRWLMRPLTWPVWRRAAVSLAAAAILVISGLASDPPWQSEPATNHMAIAIPQVLLARNLDPAYVPYLQRKVGGSGIKIRPGTADEKLLFFESPMSFYEEYHFRPEGL